MLFWKLPFNFVDVWFVLVVNEINQILKTSVYVEKSYILLMCSM